MTVTLKSFIIAFFLLILSICVYRFAQMQKQEPVADLSNLPTFTASEFKGAIYDKSGLLTYKLIANNVEYYDKENKINLVKPLLEIFEYPKNKNYENWFLSGDEGFVFINKKAEVQGNVKIYPGFNHKNIKEITASKLTYDFEKDLVKSKETVTIKGHNYLNFGSDFVADMRNNTMSYKGNPHVVYYPQKH